MFHCLSSPGNICDKIIWEGAFLASVIRFEKEEKAPVSPPSQHSSQR